MEPETKGWALRKGAAVLYGFRSRVEAECFAGEWCLHGFVAEREDLAHG